jgi:Uma2 family endonuclease
MNVDFASVATIPLPETAEALIIRPGVRPFSNQEFAEFCARNPELRIEMNSEGELIIMLPVVTRGGKRNFNLTARFGEWVERDGSGVGFDSSTGFTLPNGAKRSPDL